MHVFLTGGTGFVGSHLVTALRARGHEVTSLVRDPAKAARMFGAEPPRLVRGDLDDPAALAAGMETADAVVHLAALTAARTRAEFFAVNEGGTRAVVAAANAAGTRIRRFIYVSSLSAAGPATDGVMPSGDAVARPVSNYGRSKLAGETVVRAVPGGIILRPPAVYGPRDREMLRLFKTTRLGIAPSFGDGSQALSVVYVEDLAAAIVACLEAGPAAGVYYPAHREITTARALVAAIAAAQGARVRPIELPRGLIRPALWINGTAARLLGRATLMSADKVSELLAEAWTCSPASLEAATGWCATTALADGLRRTAEWYRQAGWL